MEVFWILGVFFIFILMAFLAFAFFLPEWVGITGAKAKEVLAEQAERPAPDSAGND